MLFQKVENNPLLRTKQTYFPTKVIDIHKFHIKNKNANIEKKKNYGIPKVKKSL